jgi:long-chain fatty acid transport protein
MSQSTHQATGARASALAAVLLFALAVYPALSQSTGALGNGLPAAAAARGGTMAAEQGDALEAVEGNPAGLAALPRPALDLSALALFAHGSFANSVDANGTLRAYSGAVPYAAFGAPIASSRWKAAIAFTPDMLMRADWHYADPPGTAGVTYGYQKNESQIIALRTSAAIARSLGSRWSLGATAGIVYNTNLLHAPYIFQQQPALVGLKVLIDLHTRGFGWNGSAGAQFQATPNLRLALAWKSPTWIQSHGDLNGTASALFAALGIAADPTFHYRAEVDNHLPQTAVAALRFQASRHAILSAETGWTGWAAAFQKLPVKLNGGSNPVINSVAGSSTVLDQVPLHWRDQGTLHLGVELPAKKSWTARAGYSYASNPVPSSTLTPVTAAILTNALSTGIGYNPESAHPASDSHPGSHLGSTHLPAFWSSAVLAPSSWRWDLAYQAQLPASQSVGHSGLLAGEYSNSRVRVLTQSLILSARINF